MAFLQNAPVTKALIVGTVAASVGNVFSTHAKLLGLRDIIERPSRLALMLVLPFNFVSTGEVFFLTLLLYSMRMIERQWGSHKFSVYIMSSVVISALLQLAMHLLSLHSRVKLQFRPGTYAICFGLLWKYITDIPAIAPCSCFGVQLSEKWAIYTLALQAALLNGGSSLVGAAGGLMGGMLTASDVLSIYKWRIPRAVRDACRKYLHPLIEPKRRSYSAWRGYTIDTQHLRHHQASAAAPPAPLNPPAANNLQALERDHESSINHLVEMGFPREQVVAALRETGSIDLAAALLIGS